MQWIAVNPTHPGAAAMCDAESNLAIRFSS
jgi:hypothetical protein